MIKRRLQILIVLGAAMALSAMSTTIAFAAPPANDDIANATPVTGVPFADGPIDTSEATAGIDDPQDCYNNGSNWYTFTPTADISIEANTVGSNYDTTLGVYSGSPGSLSLVACNDDSVYGLQSAVRFNATANTTYYFMVGFCCGNGGTGGGTLFFNVQEAPPAVDIELGVDSPGTVQNSVATVGGTVTCNVESNVQVYGRLRQRVGRDFVTGDFYVDPGLCSPPSISWSATVIGDRVFAGGKAAIEANSSGCDSFTCDFDSVSTTIRLTGGR